MDISNYINNILQKITNQHNKGTISGSTVGNAFTDLANLTKSAVELKLDIASATTLYQPIGDYQPSGNYVELTTGNTIPENLLPAIKVNGNEFEIDNALGLQLVDSYLMNKINTAIGVALGQTQLTAPTLAIGTPTTNSIPLTWNLITNAKNYILSTSALSNFATATTVYNGSGSTFTHTGLLPESTHFYRITANNTNFISSNPSNVVSGVTGAVVSGLTPYTNFTINRNVDVSGNTLTYNAVVDYGRSVSSDSVVAGAAFTFQSDINPLTNSGQLGVTIDFDGSPDYQLLGYITYAAADTANGRFWCSINGSGNDTFTNSPVPNGITLKQRVRGTGTVIHFEYSRDGGTTWIESTNVAQPQTALYLQASFNGSNAVNDTVVNITSTL